MGVLYLDFGGFEAEDFSSGPSGFVGEMADLEDIDKVPLLEILNPFFIGLLDKLMRKALYKRSDYPAVVKLVISLIVILVGGINYHNSLCESLPFLGVLNVANHQVNTEL